MPAFLLALGAAVFVGLSLGVVSAHATVGGEVAVTDDGPSRLDLWTAGPDDHVWERTYTISGGWAAWSDLGAPSGGLASEPEVLHIPDNGSTQAGKYFIFARGANDALWSRVFTPGSGWGAWTDLGGSYASGFRAAYSANGDWIDVVGRDKSDRLWWNVMHSGVWSTAQTSPGPISQTPAILDWTPPGQSPRADVFAIRTDSAIMTTTNQNLQWSAWQGLNGTATSSASASFGSGTAMVAVRGDNGTTAFVNTNGGGGWSGWLNVGGLLSTAPTVHYWPMADGRPRFWVVARDIGDPSAGSSGRPPQVILNEKIGTSWSGWNGLTPTPESSFWGVSLQYGGQGGVIDVIDTDGEVADVVRAIRDATPELARTLVDGIRPGAERDRVNAALAGADVDATVSVTHDGPDRLDFWTGTGSTVYQRSWVSGEGWSQWWNLGAPSVGLGSAPDTIRTPDGRYRIFAVGRDGGLWMRMYYPPGFSGHAEGWVDWVKLADGPYVGGVQAAYSNNGNWIDVVTRTKADNKLAWQIWTDAGGWGAAQIRPDGVLSGTPAIVDWTKPGQAPQADVFAQGGGGWVYTTTNQSLAWNAWTPMSGQATSPVDSVAGDGQVLTVLRGDDGHSVYGNSYQPSSGWGGWANLSSGTAVSSGPTAHYWPLADGSARWEIVARDGGALNQPRPGQIIMVERRGSGWNTWGGWVGISSLPGANYYGTHVQFADVNGNVNVSAAVAAIRAADGIVADALLAGLVPGAERDTVQQAAFPTSWQCGGDDHSATTTAEVNCVVSAIDAAPNDQAATTLINGLSKDNAKRLDRALHDRVQNGDYVRDISTGAVYYYADNTYNWIPSAAFASAAGIDLNSAKRITASALSGWTRGPDATNPLGWRYGGSDHIIDGADDFDRLGQGLASSSDTVGLWNQLSVDLKNTMLSYADDAFTVWARRVDTSAPTAGAGMSLDTLDFSGRQGELSWEEGDDPDLSPGVAGTQVDTAEARYRESDGSWHAWADADWGLTVANADPGDTFYVEVRERDSAGNLSAVRSSTVHIPTSPSASASFLPLVCAAICPEALELLIAGAEWEIVSVGVSSAVRVTARKSAQWIAEWEAKRLSKSGSRKALRRALEEAEGAAPGKVAHHIVPYGGMVGRRAQEILARCGVTANEAANGVWLTAAQHKLTLTKAYYENVNRVLEAYWLHCGSPGASGFGQKPIREALQDIGQTLKTPGVFPG